MFLQDFLDLGFKIKYHSEKEYIFRSLFREEEVYKEILAYAKTNPDSLDLAKFAKARGVELNGRSCYSGNELIAIGTYIPDTGYIISIEKDGIILRLEVNEDNEIYKVDDWFWYFNSSSNTLRIYDKSHIKDDETPENILAYVYEERKRNAQIIRNHYNQKLKKLKKEYKSKLEGSKVGLDFLKGFEL